MTISPIVSFASISYSAPPRSALIIYGVITLQRDGMQIHRKCANYKLDICDSNFAALSGKADVHHLCTYSMRRADGEQVTV